MEDVKSQVNVNTNDIAWMKEHMRDLKDSMKKQTAILFGILITMIGGIITLIKLAPAQ